MKYKEVEEQSKLAFNVWKNLWIKNITENDKRIETKLSEISNKYTDKKIVIFAYGPSFLENVKSFKESELYGNSIIMCVDKAFRPLTQNGIQPDFCLIADGQVDSKKWLDGVEDKYIKNSKLISNVYGNPGWSRKWSEIAGNKAIYWYLNKDNIKTHEFFADYTKYREVIPAASNVSNSCCVLASQIMGSKEIYLYAFDYSWISNKNYYGVDDNYKRAHIGHMRFVDNKLIEPDIVWASSNMDFSSRWLETWANFTKTLSGTRWFNMTGNGILNLEGCS